MLSSKILRSFGSVQDFVTDSFSVVVVLALDFHAGEKVT